MMNRYKHVNIFVLFLFLIVVCICLVSLAAYEAPDPETITLNTGTNAIIESFDSANTWYDRTNRWLGDRNDEMRDLETDLKIIQYGIDDKTTELEDAALGSLGSALDGSPFSTLAELIKRLRKKKQLWEIKKMKVEKLIEIGTQQKKVNAYAKDRDDVYTEFEKWWNYNYPYGGGGTMPEKGAAPKEVTIPEGVALECENECDTIFRAADFGITTLVDLATCAHSRTCFDLAHSGHQYWSCPREYPDCDLSRKHWRLCPGDCGEYFRPLAVLNINIDSEHLYDYFNNSPHKKVCKERKWRGPVFGWGDCNKVYYSCEDQCENGHTVTDGSTGSGSTAMAACNVHPTSDSGDHTSTYLCNISPCSSRIVPSCLAICPETGTHGKVVCTISGCQDSTPYDPTSSSAGLHAYCNECYQYKCNGGGHSWQTSCSDTAHTNTNGDSCTATGFYECVSHTPVYSAAPAPPPSTVRCPLCPVSYDPTDPDSYTNHLPVTCINCDVGFTGCTNHESACYVDGQLVGWHTTE